MSQKKKRQWAGKNHKWEGGQLLQTDKKWSHLKERQKTWIQQVAAEEHAAYVAKHGRLPIKEQKEAVLGAVYDHVNERSIWIPYDEFAAHVGNMIDRLNHWHPLFDPLGPRVPAEPKPPRCGYEDFPEEAQALMREMLSGPIQSYILQTGRIPPNRIREIDLKQLQRSFNGKRCKKCGMLLKSSDALEAVYDELRREIHAGTQHKSDRL